MGLDGLRGVETDPAGGERVGQSLRRLGAEDDLHADRVHARLTR